MRWASILFGGATLGLLPAVAEAHGIYVAGIWVDEAGALVPAVVMMILVLKLSGKGKTTK